MTEDTKKVVARKNRLETLLVEVEQVLGSIWREIGEVEPTSRMVELYKIRADILIHMDKKASRSEYDAMLKDSVASFRSLAEGIGGEPSFAKRMPSPPLHEIDSIEIRYAGSPLRRIVRNPGEDLDFIEDLRSAGLPVGD